MYDKTINWIWHMYDIKNYPNLGHCCLPQPSAHNIDIGLDNS